MAREFRVRKFLTVQGTDFQTRDRSPPQEGSLGSCDFVTAQKSRSCLRDSGNAELDFVTAPKSSLRERYLYFTAKVNLFGSGVVGQFQFKTLCGICSSADEPLSVDAEVQGWIDAIRFKS